MCCLFGDMTEIFTLRRFLFLLLLQTMPYPVPGLSAGMRALCDGSLSMSFACRYDPKFSCWLVFRFLVVTQALPRQRGGEGRDRDRDCTLRKKKRSYLIRLRQANADRHKVA